MKIRIKENTLRIRITQSELKQLLEGNNIVSSIHFPNATQLTYGLTPVTGESTSIQYLKNVISIRIGTHDMETMADDKSVGIQSIHGEDDQSLNLLVEKDFACLHPREGEDEDCFPNPNKKELS